MSKISGLFMFAAGIGIGATVATILNDPEMRGRVQKAYQDSSDAVTNRVSGAISNAQETLRKGEQVVGDTRDKLKTKIDQTAEGAKQVVDQLAEKSRGVAHKAGEQLERTGNSLQQA